MSWSTHNNSRILTIFIGLTIIQVSCFYPQRSKEKLYTQFFGQSINNCNQILESRDIKAVDDQMMYIHFKTCPDEIKRILLLVPYSFKAMTKWEIDLAYEDPNTIDESLIPSLPKWWNIRKLGDSCISFEYFHPNEDYAQVGYLSLDSTEVFYKEIAW
jgi:hypothetical protein